MGTTFSAAIAQTATVGCLSFAKSKIEQVKFPKIDNVRALRPQEMVLFVITEHVTLATIDIFKRLFSEQSRRVLLTNSLGL